MKERLDVLLVKRNLAASREKAKAIIMSGNVFVDGQREDCNICHSQYLFCHDRPPPQHIHMLPRFREDIFFKGLLQVSLRQPLVYFFYSGLLVKFLKCFIIQLC